MERTIAILDTGLAETAAVERLWRGFSFERVDLCGGDYHPHGTLVASLAMRPFDNDVLRDSVHFVHIRCGDAQGRFSEENIYRALDMIWDKDATAVNCSWGGPKPTDESHIKMAEKILSICDGGVAFHFAAGNEDTQDLDEDMSRPQALLRRGQGTYLWGALEKEGKPAWFSSDGDKLFASMWGSDRPAHGPDGLIASVSGTSFASPTGCGMCEAMLALEMFSDYDALEQNLVAVAINLTKTSEGAWSEYKDPETGIKWHPKTGAGSLEYLFQELTVSARCRPQRIPKTAARWFNFRKIG